MHFNLHNRATRASRRAYRAAHPRLLDSFCFGMQCKTSMLIQHTVHQKTLIAPNSVFRPTDNSKPLLRRIMSAAWPTWRDRDQTAVRRTRFWNTIATHHTDVRRTYAIAMHNNWALSWLLRKSMQLNSKQVSPTSDLKSRRRSSCLDI